MTNHGLVFDGPFNVGSFQLSSAEDSYGRRQLFKLHMDIEYINMETGKSKKDLQYLIVEDIGPKYKVIESLGFGSIEGGRYFCNRNFAIYQEATWSKSPGPVDKTLN